MIKIERGRESKIILDFAEKAFSLLAQRKHRDFLEQFDSSALTIENIFLALRGKDKRGKEILLIDPAIAECRNMRRIVTENQEGYHLYFELNTISKSSMLAAEVVFFFDKDMFYVILENLHLCDKQENPVT